MTSNQGNSDDSLRGLLFLSGMDTSAFNRPKSLSDMKSSKDLSSPNKRTQVNATTALAGGQPAAGSSSRLSQLGPPSGDPAAANDVDSFLGKSGSRASLATGRSTSMSSFASATADLLHTPVYSDELGFSAPSSHHLPPPAGGATSNHSLSGSSTCRQQQQQPHRSTPNPGEDPLDFLGTGEYTRGPAAHPPPPTSMDTPLGDLLGGFGGGGSATIAHSPAGGCGHAPPAAGEGGGLPGRGSGSQAMLQEALRLSEQLGSGDFGEYLGTPHAVGGETGGGAAGATQAPSEDAGGAAVGAPKQTAFQAGELPGGGAAPPSSPGVLEGKGAPATRQAAGGGLAAGRAAEDPWAAASAQPASGPPRQHKAFDMLDAPAQHARQPRAGMRGHQAASPSPHPRRGAHPHQSPLGTAKPVAEATQKAAKMLQAGREWFVRAGKTLVQDLQTSVGGMRHHHQGKQRQGAQSGSSATPPYYYDWAEQLIRISPGSRSAALEAMAEDDRLIVQRIMDEAALGEDYLGAEGMEGGAPRVASDGVPAGSAWDAQRAAQHEDGFADYNQRAGHLETPPHPPPSHPGPRSGSNQGLGDLHAGAEVDAWDEGRRRSPSPTRPSRRAPPPAQHATARGDAGSATPAPARQPFRHAQEDATRPEVEADFLGFAGEAQPPSPSPAGSAGDAHGAATAAAKAAPQAAVDDLMGFHATTTPGAQQHAPPRAGGTAAGVADLGGPSPSRHRDIEDMFTVPPVSIHQPSRGGAAPGPAAARAEPSRATRPNPVASPLDSMLDLGAELAAQVDVAEHAALYAEVQEAEDPNEPEIRKQLRQRRIQEKHQRMQQQLAEKRAREEAEATEKAGKVELREHLKPKINAWAAGKKDNIRALLSSLHTVLWEDSGWTPPHMADMVDSHKVKRIYMKANLIVHPDKVKQKGGTLEQITIADMVFDVLKMAWGKFENS